MTDRKDALIRAFENLTKTVHAMLVAEYRRGWADATARILAAAQPEATVEKPIRVPGKRGRRPESAAEPQDAPETSEAVSKHPEADTPPGEPPRGPQDLSDLELPAELKPGRPSDMWPAEKEVLLTELWTTTHLKPSEIAARMGPGYSDSMVRGKATRMGLKRPAAEGIDAVVEYLKSHGEDLRRDPDGTWYKDGRAQPPATMLRRANFRRVTVEGEEPFVIPGITEAEEAAC